MCGAKFWAGDGWGRNSRPHACPHCQTRYYTFHHELVTYCPFFLEWSWRWRIFPTYLSKGDSFYIDENNLLALRWYNEAWRNAQDEVVANELGGSCDACNPWLYLQFQILSHRAKEHLNVDNFSWGLGWSVCCNIITASLSVSDIIRSTFYFRKIWNL